MLMPKRLKTLGRTTSASMSNTAVSTSMAMLMARLIDEKVLPSPGSALVIMMCEAHKPEACDLARAFFSSGRFKWRNCSAISERTWSGTK